MRLCPHLFPASRLSRCERRLENFGIRAAATDIAARRIAYIFKRGLWITLNERRTAHNHPRRAEAALQRIMLDESLLQGMKRVARSEPFDGRDCPIGRV